MPTITFKISRVSLFATTEKEARNTQGLAYDVTWHSDADIQLETDEELSDLEYKFIVIPHTNPQDSVEKYSYILYQKGDDKGFIITKPGCLIRVYIPIDIYSSLLSSSINGAVPSDITIELNGIEYDGGIAKWNNDKNYKLAIISFSFNMPLTRNKH